MVVARDRKAVSIVERVGARVRRARGHDVRFLVGRYLR